MASQAKYTIHVPTHDNSGQQLRDLAQAAHQHLYENGVIDGSFIERGKVGNWRDYAPEGMDHLVTFANDTPETDSHLKQTAVHIGDLANQQAVTVTKESGAGPAIWIIDNPNWREGEGAHPSALNQRTAAVLHSVWPETDIEGPLRQPQARRAPWTAYLESSPCLTRESLRKA